MYTKPIQLSPSSLDLFLECPHCFWLDKKMGIRRPPPYPYALNAAVDLLLKKEFDEYRAKNEPHPLLAEHGLSAKLFGNQKLLDQWRNNFSGIRYFDAGLGATIFGAVDDVLEFEGGKLAPLDYKSTGSNQANIYDRFQLQMDVYTYLLERNGFSTPRKGYLAFYIVEKSKGFNGHLPFRKELQEVETNPDDIPQLFKEAVAVLKRVVPPPHSKDCKFGNWLNQVSKFNQS
jgi:CRISPR/Cas system-associated exonuclease Cas4 (RecB family)